MRTIKRWEIEDCGVDAPDYFRGRGTSFTSWDECCVGVGNSPQEAADDAAESLAQMDFEIPAALDSEIKALSEVSEIPENDGDDAAELYHYAAIYVKAKV